MEETDVEILIKWWTGSSSGSRNFKGFSKPFLRYWVFNEVCFSNLVTTSTTAFAAVAATTTITTAAAATVTATTTTTQCFSIGDYCTLV